MNGLKTIKTVLLSVTDNVVLGWTHKQSPPYICYLPDGADSLKTDNKSGSKKLTGSVHLFSKDPSDPLVNRLETALNICECAWGFDAIQHEEDTKLWHWSWNWEVSNGEV